ncbi:MAG: Minf_1886 family protein [Planctomycetota bacterium]
MSWCPDRDGPDERIMGIRRRDRRYARNAYYFLLDALDHTLVHYGKDQLTGEDRHVGAKELLNGVRDLAAEHFGAMASFVFRQWGVRSSEDFGEIVFNLVDAGLLSRRPEDSRLDFVGGFDFESVFEEKFQERLRRISAEATPQ